MWFIAVCRYVSEVDFKFNKPSMSDSLPFICAASRRSPMSPSPKSSSVGLHVFKRYGFFASWRVEQRSDVPPSQTVALRGNFPCQLGTKIVYIDEAIDLVHKALDIYPPSHPTRSATLNHPAAHLTRAPTSVDIFGHAAGPYRKIFQASTSRLTPPH